MTEASLSTSGAMLVRAPAKVNLMIHVGEGLPNGYHEIQTLMHTVDVFDRIYLRTNPQHENITLVCDQTSLPVDGRNLVYRAAKLVMEQVNAKVGVDIELQKVIPVASGLGGGSSNAAATIFGLAELLKLDWGILEFTEMGSRLGSDIPFFFLAPSAQVHGWGQRVESCRVSGERWAVLVNPGFAISTKWAYDQIDTQRTFPFRLDDRSIGIEPCSSLSWDDILAKMDNDFESALFPQYPILGFIKEKLLSLGAQAALLSGSGATIFGIFQSQEGADHAAGTLRQDTQWHVFVGPFGTTALPHRPIS